MRKNNIHSRIQIMREWYYEAVRSHLVLSGFLSDEADDLLESCNLKERICTDKELLSKVHPAVTAARIADMRSGTYAIIMDFNIDRYKIYLVDGFEAEVEPPKGHAGIYTVTIVRYPNIRAHHLNKDVAVRLAYDKLREFLKNDYLNQVKRELEIRGYDRNEAASIIERSLIKDLLEWDLYSTISDDPGDVVDYMIIPGHKTIDSDYP